MVTTLYDAKGRPDILMLGEYEKEKQTLYIEALSPHELSTYNQKPDSKKADFLLGRWVAKHCLREYFKRSTGSVYPLSSFEVRPAEGGAPTVWVDASIRKQSALGLPHISISHTEGPIAVVRVILSGACQGVGVDVEFVRPWNEFLVSRYLTEAEYQFIKKSPLSEREKLATVFWSLKESYLKALGVGLRKHPQTVDMLGFKESAHFEKEIGNVTGGWLIHQSGCVVSSVFLS